MADPNAPTPTPEQQAALDQLKERKAFVMAIHDLVEPFAFATLLEQLALFEEKAEAGVKGDVRKDREWAEKLINILRNELKGAGLELDGQGRVDYGKLIAVMEALVPPKPEARGGAAAPLVGYPPEHKGYPEGEAYQHGGKWHIKKAGILYWISKDGIIRDPKGWPVGTYDFATKAIHWQEKPGYPPQTLTYAQQLLNECATAMEKIEEATEKQEEQLDAMRGVEDILTKREAEILQVIQQMKEVYAKNRGLGAEARLKGTAFKGKGEKITDKDLAAVQKMGALYPEKLHGKLVELAAELQEIGVMLRDAVQPLSGYLNLLSTSRLDPALIHNLTSRVKVLDTLINEYSGMRAALFEQMDDVTRDSLKRLGVTDNDGLIRHLEASVDRQRRFAEARKKVKFDGLVDYIQTYRTLANSLITGIKGDRFDYEKADLADAFLIRPDGKSIFDVMVKSAQDSIAVLVALEKVQKDIADEIRADRIALQLIERSLETVEEKLGLAK
jgi:hypothetical protein